MSEKHINFGPLAPWPDKDGFESIVQTITRRAVEARNQQQVSYSFQITSLIKPAFALAASLVVVVWIAAFATGQSSSDQRDVTPTDPTYELSNWAMIGAEPSTDELIRIFGGSNE